MEVDPHHILIEDPDGSCTLILDNLTGVDSGQYMCFAASAAGNASTLGKILVQGEQDGFPGVVDTPPVHCQGCRLCPEYRLWEGGVWGKPEDGAGPVTWGLPETPRGRPLLEVRTPQSPPQLSLSSITDVFLSFLPLPASAHSAPTICEQGPGHALCGGGGCTDHLHCGRCPISSDQVRPGLQKWECSSCSGGRIGQHDLLSQGGRPWPLITAKWVLWGCDSLWEEMAGLWLPGRELY